MRPRIVARLAAGERLTHICREAGMPCHESVTGWMRRDAAFAGEVAHAKAQGDWRRRFRFDAARADAFLARLAAGERLGDLIRDPAMPSYGTFLYWRRTQGEFAERLHILLGVKAAQKAGRLHARYRAFDPEIAERIYVRVWKGEKLRAVLRSDKAFPSLTVLERWRRQDREFDAMLRTVFKAWSRKRGRERALYTPELAEAIVAHIVEGHSLRSLSRLPGMPSQGALNNWARTRPEFAAAVAQACEDREDWYRERMLAAAERVVPGGERAARREIAELAKQMTRLRKRPGWKRRRAARGASSISVGNATIGEPTRR